MKTAGLTLVGGGAVGMATAWAIARRNPSLAIRLLEKNRHLAAHQTGHNSGVIHSGIYYPPGSLKARNCVEGRRQLVDFARAEGIPHEVCGKVIAAADDSELPRLQSLLERGRQNGLEGLRELDAAELSEIEPHCRSVGGLFVPQTGIINYRELTQRLAERFQAINSDNEIHLGKAVRGIRRDAAGYELSTPAERFRSPYLITCGGLHSDRLARMEGLKPASRILGFRGDYYELVPAAQHKVRNLIYPVPNPQFPFLGVHFTRMIEGGVECGPNAVFAFAREGYAKTALDLGDTAEAFGFKGTWQFFGRHWRFGLDEYRRAFSKKRFLRTLQRLIPALEAADLRPGRSGVRAMALSPAGEMLDDFVFAGHEHAIHVLNAPSPAATACLAIGEHIAGMAAERFGFD